MRVSIKQHCSVFRAPESFTATRATHVIREGRVEVRLRDRFTLTRKFAYGNKSFVRCGESARGLRARARTPRESPFVVGGRRDRKKYTKRPRPTPKHANFCSRIGVDLVDRIIRPNGPVGVRLQIRSKADGRRQLPSRFQATD